MFILFGFTVRGTTRGTGTFSCPREGGDREYQRQQLRRWFTLFFIPLVPLNTVGEAVHCTSCGGDWEPAVLTRPTTARLRDDLAGLVTLVATALCGGGSASMGAATDWVLEHGGDVDRLDPSDDVAPATIEEGAAALHGQVSTAGTERLVGAAMVVADADGALDDHDLRVLTALASGLGMTEAHFEGVLATHRRQRST